VHGEVEVLGAAAVALGPDFLSHRRRHHLGRPRLEQGEVERHEDDGEEDDHGHQHAAADQDGPPLPPLGDAHFLLCSLGLEAQVNGTRGGGESGHM